jgi:hypothetical protein
MQIASIAISDITDTVRSFSAQALFYGQSTPQGYLPWILFLRLSPNG